MTKEPKSYRFVLGDEVWYLPSYGITHLHRLDGPAVVNADGTKQWWVDNILHRLDGPAIEYVSGKREWWVDGVLLSKRKVENWLYENNVDLKTLEGQMAFKLRWT